MKKIILCSFAIIIFGCQDQVIELDIPTHTPFLVVNSILDTDSIISLHVSNSVGAFEEGQINSISDANVLLYEDGNLLGEMMVNFENTDSLSVIEQFPFFHWDGYDVPIYYYIFDAVPQVSSTYSIDVSHSNYESVFAQTTIPNQIELSSLDTIDNSSESELLNLQLNLSFLDNPNENNYYRIRLFLHTNGSDPNGTVHEKPLILYSNDPSFSQGDIFTALDGYSFSGRRVLFSDDLFNGMEKEISLDFEYKIEGLDNGDSIFLQLTSFSEEAYNYYNSMELNNDGFFFSFGTEPIPVFSNVENGAGIFASGTSVYFPVLP